MRSVVITPTTGVPELAQAIQSVARQGDGVQHWVVVDGVQYAEKAIKIVQENQHPGLRLIILPENTGKPSYYFKEIDAAFYGHRVYAGIANFINADYTFFLDEDNWYEDDHIKTMTGALSNYKLDWCYSLRKIVNGAGEFLCEDNCDSLGMFPNQENVSFVDMNCYGFKTEFLLKLLLVFQKPSYNCDRELFKHAVALCSNPSGFGGTGRYTVNYRITTQDKESWFIDGNERIKKIYNVFPWRV